MGIIILLIFGAKLVHFLFNWDEFNWGHLDEEMRVPDISIKYLLLKRIAGIIASKYESIRKL
jgi:hypothetical protein